jgi:hypothetical protein
MFVIVSTYRAKAGEEDAIIALHEDWQRLRGSGLKTYLSWELLRKIDFPREFIEITHFESQELACAMLESLAQDAWHLRLVSLMEDEPVRTDYAGAWKAGE